MHSISFYEELRYNNNDSLLLLVDTITTLEGLRGEELKLD